MSRQPSLDQYRPCRTLPFALRPEPGRAGGDLQRHCCWSFVAPYRLDDSASTFDDQSRDRTQWRTRWLSGEWCRSASLGSCSSPQALPAVVKLLSEASRAPSAGLAPGRPTARSGRGIRGADERTRTADPLVARTQVEIPIPQRSGEKRGDTHTLWQSLSRLQRRK